MVSIMNSLKSVPIITKLTLNNQGFNILKTMNLNPSLLESLQPNTQLQFVRTKMVRRIRGGGRPTPPGLIPPEPHKYKFTVNYPKDGKYTTKALQIIKMGGRHPETGHVVVETLGGGHKQKFRWVDYKHKVDPEKPFVEKIMYVRYCPIRTALIAFAASGTHCRWVIAHQGMKAGDLITTYSEIPRIPIRPKQGDSHPVGALPIGTMIFNISPAPDIKGMFCKAAGSYATLIRKTPDKKCVVMLPSKREISISEKSMVTVGQASNLEKAGQIIGSPNRLRWLGNRPRTGLWHRKDGYCGRKIRPPKSMKVYDENFTQKTDHFVLNL